MQILAFPRWITERIAEECPKLVQAQEDLALVLRKLVAEIVNDEGLLSATDRAQNLIFNQLLNDFLDLLYEVMTGRGRPAMRSTRSLFEHLVNHRTVSNDASEAQRYVDHAPVVDEFLYSLNLHRLGVLSSESLKKQQRENAHLKKKASRTAKKAREKYGSSYKRSWAGKNLRDRASDHNLTESYDFYRVASAVMHGSAGGAIGTFGIIQSGHETHRTGPALGLLPLSFAFGVSFFDEFLEGLDQTDVISEARRILADLRSEFERYSHLVIQIDRGLAPPDIPLMVVARINTLFKVEWWVHDREQGRVARIDQPELSQAQKETLNGLLAELKRRGVDHPVTAAMYEARTRIPLESQWRKATEILNELPLSIDLPDTRPRIIDDWREIT